MNTEHQALLQQHHVGGVPGGFGKSCCMLLRLHLSCSQCYLAKQPLPVHPCWRSPGVSSEVSHNSGLTVDADADQRKLSIVVGYHRDPTSSSAFTKLIDD